MDVPELDNFLMQRFVNVPCPSGKHDRSIVTFRDYSIAVMFCIACEESWTEPVSHPEVRAIRIDRMWRY